MDFSASHLGTNIEIAIIKNNLARVITTLSHRLNTAISKHAVASIFIFYDNDGGDADDAGDGDDGGDDDGGDDGGGDDNGNGNAIT